MISGWAPADLAWALVIVVVLAWCAERARPQFLLLACCPLPFLPLSNGGLVALGSTVVASVAGAALQSPRWRRWAGALLGAVVVIEASDAEPRQGALLVAAIVVLLVAGVASAPTPERRRAARLAAVASALLVVTAGLGLLAAAASREAALDASAHLDAARLAARDGDIEVAADRFEAARRSLDAARRWMGTLGLPLRALPLAGLQAQAVDALLDAADEVTEAGRDAVRDIDVDSLRVVDGRVDLAAIEAAAAPADDVAAAFVAGLRRLSEVERDWLVGPVDDALVEASSRLEAGSRDADLAAQAFGSVPTLLGAGGERRYLLLFTTPVEARNRFGFPGAYAVVAARNGRLAVRSSGSIASLVSATGAIDQQNLAVPPRALPYLGFGVTSEWRSVTIPPDLPTVAALVAEVGPRTPIGPVDGVVVIDPVGVAALLGIVGPVELPDAGLSVDQHNAVDFLTRDQYLRFPEEAEQGDRRDLLQDVADEVAGRLQRVSLPEIPRLVSLFSPVVEGGHLAIAVVDTGGPAVFLARAGIDGALSPVAVDLLMSGHLNAGGSKIDLFLRRMVHHDVTIGADGTADARTEIVLFNDAPAEGLPYYLIGSVLEGLPPGTNRTTVLAYGRHPIADVRVDGEAIAAAPFHEAELFGAAWALDLAPGQHRTVSFSSRWALIDRPYELQLLPSGVLTPDEVTVTVSDERTGWTASRSLRLDVPVDLVLSAEGLGEG